jgi:mannosyltransferase
MDAVIATSVKSSRYLEVPNTVIMHGIDCDTFRPAEDKREAKRKCSLDPALRYVGCFGRVRHQKGTDLFVDSMINILPSNPGWAAIVAGRATAKHLAFEEELKAKVRAAGLADRILFVGEHKNIADWYRTLDLFVAPQRWEGFGLTPLESMASGVPVVATDVGAFSELVSTDTASTGIVLPSLTPEAMQSAISELMQDTGRLSVMATNALQRARSRFSIENEARSLGDCYSRLQV